MKIPGFTAEASVYRPARSYLIRRGPSGEGGPPPMAGGRGTVGPAAYFRPVPYYPCPIGCSEVCEVIPGVLGRGETVCRCIC